MNSRRLQNSHQRHKFLRAEASRDILKLLKSRIWCHVVSSEYMQDWEHYAVKMSQVFQDNEWFERFTDLNLFEYAFIVIQKWEMDALQFYQMVLIFCQQLWQKDVKVAGGFGRLPAPIDSPVWFDFILGLNVVHCFKLITIPQNKGK